MSDRVLVVENEEIVALDLRECLEGSGYVVRSARSGEEAIGIAREFKPDAVVIDIRLDGKMDGIETAATIRNETKSAIIFLTAYSDRHTVARAAEVDPAGYIVKPFNERELGAMLYLAIHQRRTRAQHSVASPSEKADAASEDEAKRMGPLRIGVVDLHTRRDTGLQGILEQDGYQVKVVDSSRRALDLIDRWNPHGVVINLDAANKAGLTLVGDLRRAAGTSRGVGLPILVRSGICPEEVRVQFFDLGADDYICSSAGAAELTARIRALLRRPSRVPAGLAIRVGDLELDVVRRQVFRGGVELALTKKEFHILECLAERMGTPLAPETLLERVWGPQFLHYVQTLRVHIGNLRQKIDSPTGARIETVHGSGYRLVEGPSASPGSVPEAGLASALSGVRA